MEVVKIFLCADDMILHMRDHKCSTRKFTELIIIFHKMTDNKINLQKPVTLLHTSDKHIEK